MQLNAAVPGPGSIPYSECQPKDEIFSFLDQDTGEEIHFNATKMYDWVTSEVENVSEDGEHPQILYSETEITESFVQHIVEKKGVDMEKLARLIYPQAQPFIDRPYLGVEFPDGTHLLIDGHHRVVYRHLKGITSFQSFLVKWPHWQRITVAMHMPRLSEYLGA